MEKQNKEYDEWMNSTEGVLYSLDTMCSRTVEDDIDRTTIAKTLLKLPKKVKQKVLNEVCFMFTRASGTVENLSLSKTFKKNELKFKSIGLDQDITPVTLEQPVIVLNFSEMKKGRELDIIAHEIAHFILGHHKSQNNPSNEREADDLTEEWGFKRAYKDYKQFERKS